jgi:2-dehydro-3-deoxyphosphogluconate aldolase/(4S)-4-hydroxy-2-oxoglutarate aldolase
VSHSKLKIEDIAALAPIIPVLVIDDIEVAVPLAKALVAGGLTVLEVTLRTPVALEAIARISTSCPTTVVGAGTIRNAADIAACRTAGAAFGVSPGTSAALAEAIAEDSARNGPWPFLPGCATATEAMALEERGFKMLKFFPAQASGGAPFLKSLASPLPDLSFCPTGGLDAGTAPSYLSLPNVPVVGGSWMVDSGDLKRGAWSEIERKARDAVRSVVVDG